MTFDETTGDLTIEGDIGASPDSIPTRVAELELQVMTLQAQLSVLQSAVNQQLEAEAISHS